MTHYFDQDPESEHRYRLIEAEFEGQSFSFRTDSGVFSGTEVDYGTALLIDNVLQEEPDAAGRLLDLGSGYGVVSVVFRKLRPDLEIVASDVNRRALELVNYNLHLNNLSETEVVESDGLAEIVGDFDLILLNPPIRAGKETVYKLYRESHTALKPEGRFYLVIRKKQGAPSTVTELESYWDEVEVIKKKSGYWIIRCTKSAK
ncbi:MAG TPA: class I SAM-dependent methyltransferase [Clostridiaceae bacterium]|nr:class I SAM-dependent methyltransferase [Clostridiaceae bacterium]